MSRIETIFSDLRSRQAKGLMPFVCAGRPTLDATPEMLRAVAGAGASIIEVGFPFSDPIADGPVIAAAMHEALKECITPRMIFDGVRAVRGQVKAGLVAMVTVSIVHRLGVKEFVAQAKEAGFDGFIFPDCPVDEVEDFTVPVREAGLTASLLIAPTTPMERAARIAKASSGFVYLLARTGITGERTDAPEVAERVAALREVTDLPIACGFGISTPEQVKAVAEHADAVIVGSALVRRVEDAAKNGADATAVARDFVASLAAGLK
jgi:tryptophan synthase alpha chain